MSIYRCAACGSPNVVADTQKEGYDYVKGAIGTIVLGAGGAAAGINGKTRKVFKCPDCGLTMNEPMSSEIQILIDMGVMNPDFRKKLELNGVPIEWEILTKKYKNIEKDAIPTPVIDSKPTIEQSTQNETELASVEEIEKGKIIYKVAEIYYGKECKAWSDAMVEVIEKRKQAAKDMAENEKARIEKSLVEERDSKVAEHTQKRKQYKEDLAKAEEKLTTLGFFQFEAKKEARNEIEALTYRITNEEKLINEAKQAYTKEKNSINETVLYYKARKQVEAQYPNPKRPKMPKAMWVFTEIGTKPSYSAIADMAAEEEILNYISDNPRSKVKAIKENCNYCMGMTDKYVLRWLKNLESRRDIMGVDNDVCSVNQYPNVMYKASDPISDEELKVYEEYLSEIKDKQQKVEA